MKRWQALSRGDVLLDCIGSDVGISNGVALNEGDSLSGKELVLQVDGFELQDWVG